MLLTQSQQVSFYNRREQSGSKNQSPPKGFSFGGLVLLSGGQSAVPIIFRHSGHEAPYLEKYGACGVFYSPEKAEAEKVPAVFSQLTIL